MTEQETIKVVTIIVMSYPSTDKFKDEATLKGMVAVWKTIFKDDDAKLVEMAVQKHISVSKWPPSIAEVREQMIDITRPDIIPPDIAWAAVEDLMNVKGEYSDPDLYYHLPEPIARVVEVIGYSKLYKLHCNRYGHNADGMDRVAFMDLYKPAYARERENAMLPPRIRSATEQKRAEIGGAVLKQLDSLHAERMEKDSYYKSLEQRNLHRYIGGSDKKCLAQEAI